MISIDFHWNFITTTKTLEWLQLIGHYVTTHVTAIYPMHTTLKLKLQTIFYIMANTS
jgi:hypothetical protein